MINVRGGVGQVILRKQSLLYKCLTYDPSGSFKQLPAHSNVKHSHYICKCSEAQDTPPIRHLLNVLAFPPTIKLTRETEIEHTLL